jgi:PIN domain nuclease of toxin-antitoxin system
VERNRLIVLDTHAWIWWVSEPERLSSTARQSIAAAKRIGIPAICCWEFATLVSKRRIVIDRNPKDWLEDALSLPGVELIPINPGIAVAAAELGGRFPGDPADRLIVASAKIMGGLLVTKDERLLKLQAIASIW